MPAALEPTVRHPTSWRLEPRGGVASSWPASARYRRSAKRHQGQRTCLRRGGCRIADARCHGRLRSCLGVGETGAFTGADSTKRRQAGERLLPPAATCAYRPPAVVRRIDFAASKRPFAVSERTSQSCRPVVHTGARRTLRCRARAGVIQRRKSAACCWNALDSGALLHPANLVTAETGGVRLDAYRPATIEHAKPTFVQGRAKR